MLARMSYRQLVRWRLYDQVRPLGNVRQLEQSAHIAAALWNQHRGKNVKAARAEDFILRYERRKAKPKKQTMEEQKAIALHFTQLIGGTVTRKKKNA